MKTVAPKLNEQRAEKAFSKQSAVFDELYSDNAIVNYKRARVREHVLKLLQPGSDILELNSGTGEDAVFFANHGHKVHATDISKGMQVQLRRKVVQNKLTNLISSELCSYTQLQSLHKKGPYDHVFSNFAGLNCTGKLDDVLKSLPDLLKPDGTVTLVILPKFCLWESSLVFKGKFRTAFRRWFSKNGVKAHLEGTYFTCWYYNPSYIINCLKGSFNMVGLEGLCTIVPPSYIEGFAEKHPTAYAYLKRKEDKLKSCWPWKYIGDYYIISFKRKPQPACRQLQVFLKGHRPVTTCKNGF